MAAFRTHYSTGLIIGYLAGAASVVCQWHTTPLVPFYMFTGASIGSLLPDVDCDNSTPFSILFTMLAILGGSLVFALWVVDNTWPWKTWLAVPPLFALFIRYGIGKLFQTFTVHRGIFHSLPMTIIVIGITMLILRPFRISPTDNLAISLSVGAGFVSHLVLDELYAAVNFSGLSLGPKKSFGTALSLASRSGPVTFITYVVLGIMALLNWHVVYEGLGFSL